MSAKPSDVPKPFQRKTVPARMLLIKTKTASTVSMKDSPVYIEGKTTHIIVRRFIRDGRILNDIARKLDEAVFSAA